MALSWRSRKAKSRASVRPSIIIPQWDANLLLYFLKAYDTTTAAEQGVPADRCAPRSGLF